MLATGYFPSLLFLYALIALAYLLTQKQMYRGHVLVKVLPILILCGLAIAYIPAPYTLWVLLALLFSAGGDVVLGLDSTQYFVVGLGLFLIAHLFYVVALAQNLAFTTISLLPLLLLLILMVGLVSQLYPQLGKLRVPVMLYIGVIAVMGIAATLHAPFSTLLVVGAIIFILSDATIAINKFLQPVPYRDFIVMATYYTAQLLLVLGFTIA